MSKPALFTFTLALLGLAPLAQASPPDRCGTLDEYGYPTECAPASWRDASYWGGDICCIGHLCVEPSSRGCTGKQQTYWCEYADYDEFGRLQCLFLISDYCDEFPCEPRPTFQSEPQEVVICCYDSGGCWEYSYPQDGGCIGNILHCDHGSCNPDGTITCDSLPE